MKTTLALRLTAAVVVAFWCLAVADATAAERVDLEGPVYAGEGTAFYGPFRRNEASSIIGFRGFLNFPKNASGPVPLVIVAHTSGGPGAADTAVRAAMNEAGFAALEYDSYTPRDWRNVNISGGGPRLEAHQTADAYGALKAMQTNPKIDGKRVAIVGMSAGGNTALLAASETLRTRYVGENGPRFAALVALYPGGYLLPTASDTSSKTPIFILPAEKDDFMKWERTKVWVDYVKRENPAVSIDAVLVPDAYHSYMNKDAPSRQFNRDTPVGGTCPYTLADFKEPAITYLNVDGSIGRVYDPSCRARGATTGYSSKAAQFAMEQTVAFLKKSFAAVN